PQEQLPPRNLSPEQRKHLWLLLKEAVNNAAKHSGGTELAIYASCKTGHLHISIIDNGSGLNGANSATRFSGKGLGDDESARRAAQWLVRHALRRKRNHRECHDQNLRIVQTAYC
ncbi:MAG: ATP-binding protein, partial [bacterium]